MQVLAGGRNRAVAECSLHQMNRGAAVERVRTVGVPHPVRRDIQLNPSALRRFPNNAPHLFGTETDRFPALLFPGHEHRTAGLAPGPQLDEQFPDRTRQLDGARFSAFAEDGRLSFSLPLRLQVLPIQVTQLLDPDAARV